LEVAVAQDYTLDDFQRELDQIQTMDMMDMM
jgi:hypothetical protein